MNRMIYSVFDKKALTFGQPMFVPNDAVMFRSMRDEVGRREDGNLLSSHPEDFCVYCLGSFDDVKGVIIPEPSPRSIFEASAFVENKGAC